MTLPRAPVLGTPVTVCRFDEAVAQLAAWVDRASAEGAAVAPGRGAAVSCANAYSVTAAGDDPDFARVLREADLVSADGMPVVWALRAAGHRQAERVHNDDLFLACCAAHPHWRHFLLGGRDGQPERVAAEMARRFPGIQVVGHQATPRRPLPPAEHAAAIAAIRATRPSIVWVGMGTPAQDLWMHAARHEIGLPLVGVGSLFDLLAGHTRAAPAWMKRAGLQWLFRLLQEPRRLARRYAVYNTRFVLGLARQALRGRP